MIAAINTNLHILRNSAMNINYIVFSKYDEVILPPQHTDSMYIIPPY